jgi:hypothetical protein
MRVIECEQGSDRWHKARLGIPTASRYKDIVTPARGDKSKSYTAYLYELLAERVTGEPSDTFMSEWMQRGNELEPAARSAYAFLCDVEVQQVGFITNDAGTIGASPDGLIGTDGGLEIKCPKPSTLVRYMVEDKLPDIYKPQVQGNLWICEREWWDFVAYHPSMELFIKRVYRDDAYIEKLRQHITAFVEELEETYQRIST